jgi:hypothetical protein
VETLLDLALEFSLAGPGMSLRNQTPDFVSNQSARFRIVLDPQLKAAYG